MFINVLPILSLIIVPQSNKTLLVSMTCDAWQASNADAYFAVTGHWSEKVSEDLWEEHSALLGFSQMNSKHDGVNLGLVLYKIVRRLGFRHKVSKLLFPLFFSCSYICNTGRVDNL